FRVEVEVDVGKTDLSPGVRGRMVTVGQQAAFDQGRKQMEPLAGLSVTTKAVERTAEAIGADIERRQQRELVTVSSSATSGQTTTFTARGSNGNFCNFRH